MFKFEFIIFIIIANTFRVTISDTRAIYPVSDDSSEESKESYENRLIINVEKETIPKRIPSSLVTFRESEQDYSINRPDNGIKEESNRRTETRGKTNFNKSSTNRDNQSLNTVQINKTMIKEITILNTHNEDDMSNGKTYRAIENESNSYQGPSDFLMPSNDKSDEEKFPKKSSKSIHVDEVVLIEKENSSRLSNTFHGTADFMMPINDDKSNLNELTENSKTMRPYQNNTSYNREDEMVFTKVQNTSNKQKSNNFVNDMNLNSKGISSNSKQTNRGNSVASHSINTNQNIVNHAADKQSQNKILNSKRKTGTGLRKKHRLCEQKYMEYMERIFDDNDTVSDGSDMDFDGRVLAEPGEYPHMTALGFEEPDQPIDYKCGGSLISENFVLTAAHCANLTGETPTKVRIGDLNLMVDEGYLEPQIRNIRRIIEHPDYRSSLYYNDIALLEMEDPVEFTEFVRPIRLWTGKESLDNITAHAMGYGATAFGKVRTNRLTDMNLTIVPNDICNRELPEMPEAPMGITFEQICARDYLMNRDTCQGDSGGPLQLNIRGRRQRHRKHYHLIGITSFGLFCRSSYPSVYTRVSEYLDWIEQIVWR